MTETEFIEFPKIFRLSREIIVTEKIDGTNAQVFVDEDACSVRAGSRNRWITPETDNFGFAAWVRDHGEELRGLGPGRQVADHGNFGRMDFDGLQRHLNLFAGGIHAAGMKTTADIQRNDFFDPGFPQLLDGVLDIFFKSGNHNLPRGV